MAGLDQSAEFVALWNAHSRRVYAFIYSLVGNWADADDLFQDTGMAVFSQFGDFKVGTQFGAWACQIAYNKVMSHHRKRRIGDHLDEVVLESLRDQSLDMSATVSARFAALNDCMNEMPTKNNRLIKLRYHRSATIESIAKQTGRTTSAVYKALAKIHEALLECIQRKLAEEDAS